MHTLVLKVNKLNSSYKLLKIPSKLLNFEKKRKAIAFDLNFLWIFICCKTKIRVPSLKDLSKSYKMDTLVLKLDKLNSSYKLF